MTARVLVIGFDACEATLVETWAAEGVMPHFAALMGRGRSFRLSNPMRTLPGAIWPEIHTGRSSGRDACFYVPRQLRTGESLLRSLHAGDMDSEAYYWTRASRAGQRVAVIDPVHRFAERTVPGGYARHVRRYGAGLLPLRTGTSGSL